MTPQVRAPLDVLRRFAPGTPLREATELILIQGTGGLIAIGDADHIESVCSGGFHLDNTPFTAQRLAELAKMDGGIVVDSESGLIVRANVHFIPDPSIPTNETGTRFRTAERVSVQTGAPVLALSEEGQSHAVVYTGADRFVLQTPTALLGEANQRLQSLERLRRQLDEAEDRLTRYEVDDVVQIRDAVKVIQRAALILRINEDLELLAVELGDEAPLIRIQAADLVEGVGELAELVNFDYQPRKPRLGSSVFTKLDAVPVRDLYNPHRVVAALGLPPLEHEARPRGARALAGVPRLPTSVRDALVRRFGDYQHLREASAQNLAGVEGVGRTRATQIRTYLDRRDEAGILSVAPE
jgi:diadenylate cyclase